MLENHITYLIEFLSSDMEKVFIKSLRDTPDDELTKAAYADWLEEQNRLGLAAAVRNGFIPSMGEYKPISPLIASGMVYSYIPYACFGGIGSLTTKNGV